MRPTLGVVLHTRARLFALVLILSIGVPLDAQRQLATVMSGSAFKLRGANVTPSLAIPSWPVLPGDSVKAGVLPLTLRFTDGSVVVVSPGGRATLQLADGLPVFVLESESAHYTLTAPGAMRLFARSAPVEPEELSGEIDVGTRRLPPEWWTPRNAGLLLAGAAAISGVTVGLVRGNGPSVSPVR